MHSATLAALGERVAAQWADALEAEPTQPSVMVALKASRSLLFWTALPPSACRVRLRAALSLWRLPSKLRLAVRLSGQTTGCVPARHGEILRGDIAWEGRLGGSGYGGRWTASLAAGAARVARAHFDGSRRTTANGSPRSGNGRPRPRSHWIWPPSVAATIFAGNICSLPKA